MMIDEQEIIDKIAELREKKWISKDEETKLRLKNGELNRDRMVQFGGIGMLDVYNSSRFSTIINALEWALNDI